jgi:D-alanyl-D-alanine carboxypeptidase
VNNRNKDKNMNIFQMIIGKFTLTCLAVLFLAAHTVHADNATQDMEKHLESLLPAKSEWALVAVDMETGNTIAQYGNSRHVRLVPASLTKLLTTGAVLEYAEHGGTGIKMVTRRVKVIRKKKRRVRRSFQRIVKINDSEQLNRILHDMNVHSRNNVAQSLADFLGERYFGPPGTSGKGARAVVRFLNTLDLPEGGAIIADGCGLKRENRITAQFMAQYLFKIGKKPWFERFRKTLPRPGMEGTVKRIGYTDPGFRVKTGHLDDVFALAGYGSDSVGRDFSFAFIVNVKKGRAFDRNHSRGEVLRLLAGGELQQAKAEGL